MSPTKALSLCLLLLLAADVSLARGQGDGSGSGPGAAGKGQARTITPAEAGERVRSQTGGRVLSVNPNGNGYEVKVLTPQGEVRRIRVPGR